MKNTPSSSNVLELEDYPKSNAKNKKQVNKKTIQPGIRQRGKKYYVRVRIKTNEGIKDSEIAANSQQEAIKLQDDYNQVFKTLNNQINPQLKFTSLIQIYKEKKLKYKNSNVTIEREVKDIENYIKPYFKNKKVFNITTNDINTFVNHLKDLKNRSGKPFSKNTVKTIISTLKNIFNYAYRNGLIVTNPIDKMEPLSMKSKSHEEYINILSDNEIAKILKTAKEHHDIVRYLLILTNVTLGLRDEELVALTWDCINVARKEVTIKYSIQTLHENSLELKGKCSAIHSTQLKKDATRRTIPFDGDVLNILLAHKDEIQSRPEYNEKLNLIFTNEDGRMLNTSNLRDRIKDVRKKAGIYFRPHDLRHTLVSKLIDNQVPLPEISRRIGHANVGVTMKYYAHLLDRNYEKSSNAISSLVKNILDK